MEVSHCRRGSTEGVSHCVSGSTEDVLHCGRGSTAMWSRQYSYTVRGFSSHCKLESWRGDQEADRIRVWSDRNQTGSEVPVDTGSMKKERGNY